MFYEVCFRKGSKLAHRLSLDVSWVSATYSNSRMLVLLDWMVYHYPGLTDKSLWASWQFGADPINYIMGWWARQEQCIIKIETIRSSAAAPRNVRLGNRYANSPIYHRCDHSKWSLNHLASDPCFQEFRAKNASYVAGTGSFTEWNCLLTTMGSS